ncbi:HAMP domain-containing sensor histidine kinase [Cryobacterium sp. PH31-AA6]|uniref:sensor histidine kinase n=1 Tax=Cryobacterium sp. PH31-AA6 TaxID=3046205 RepID=UPI0024B9D18D|nr:HAMP domain-containing sensor histidine kinase [Cryobacterium sp. PH31-AA6]MDJ0322638.1 HAMP domain-containing sensor histidine kinase [Cryobacterium sp. PH31-AA6]
MIFRSAVRRLTIAFTLIQLLLFWSFAFGIYVYVTGTFDFDSAQADGVSAVNAAEQGFANLRIGLLVGSAVLTIIVPVISYLMARVALRPARESYNAQQRFVDDASHEFRTPLSVIQGELELARSRPRSAAYYQAAIDETLEVVNDLATLTTDLLLLARGSDAEITATFEPTLLNMVIERAVRPYLATTGNGPSLHVELRDLVAISGSPELLIRAVGNIVDNAIKFTPESGSVTIRLDRQADAAVIEVIDDGIGMTPNEASHAFKRFWRGDGSRTVAGHGLGLALVKQICDAHSGTIGVRPGSLAGTVVTLTFPSVD